MSEHDPESSVFDGFFAQMPFNRADISTAVSVIILIAIVQRKF